MEMTASTHPDALPDMALELLHEPQEGEEDENDTDVDEPNKQGSTSGSRP